MKSDADLKTEDRELDAHMTINNALASEVVQVLCLDDVAAFTNLVRWAQFLHVYCRSLSDSEWLTGYIVSTHRKDNWCI